MTVTDVQHVVPVPRFKPVEMMDIEPVQHMYSVSPAGQDENMQNIFRTDNASPFLPGERERALGKVVNHSSRQGGWAQGAMDNMMNGINQMSDGGGYCGNDPPFEPPFEFCCITPTASLFTGMTPTPLAEAQTPTQDGSGAGVPPKAGGGQYHHSPPKPMGDHPPPRLHGGPLAGHVPLSAGHHQISRPGAMRDARSGSSAANKEEESGELGVGKRRRVPVARDLPEWRSTKEDSARNNSISSGNGGKSGTANSRVHKPKGGGGSNNNLEVSTARGVGGEGGRAEGQRIVTPSSKKKEIDASNVALKSGQVDDAARAKAMKQREDITAVLYKKDTNAGNSGDASRKGGKYKGVTWDRAKRMWRVRVCLVGGSRQHIGYYADEEAGAEAYLDALKQLGV